MKSLGLLLISTLIFSTSCFNYKSLFVKADYSYKGDFTNYKSYYLMNSVQHNDTVDQTKSTLEDLIKYQMELHGYEPKESEPNLLVQYHIFKENIKLRGYDQPELMYWLNTQREGEYDPITLKLPEGTLIIQLIDTKQDQIIWQGYASGFLNRGTSLYDPRDLKRAVFLIFDNYRTFAKDYIVEGAE